MDLIWKALPNYFEGKEETGLFVVDTSGSMYGTPIEVAASLGIYCADKAKGPFHNHFITFSAYPKLQELIGETIDEKYLNLCGADWGANTNLEAVFDLILNTAIKNKMDPADLPSKLYIISDMQFDMATRMKEDSAETSVFMDTIRNRFEKAGYKMPAIVYWNVRQSNCGMFQAKAGDVDCAIVSGYSPSLFKAVIEGTTWKEEGGTVKQEIDPITVMETALLNERYDRVKTEV